VIRTCCRAFQPADVSSTSSSSPFSSSTLAGCFHRLSCSASMWTLIGSSRI
jgi:hypothetical protein